MSDPRTPEYVCKMNRPELSPSHPLAQADCAINF